MKLIPILTAVLAFIAASALVGGTSDFDRCGDKAPEVVAAISQYCTRLGNKNFVPNGLGQNGYEATYRGKKAKIWMRAECNPKQWVPKIWCFRQFYNLCANGDKKGNNQKNYGNNGCQHWYINN